MSRPRISIITPCLNRAQFIRQAIESVLAQEYPYFEHIVMDGGSTDGTLAILREYPHLRFYSESDHGMYDAINKGIGLAEGEIVGLLNSDDLYAPDSLALVAESFARHPGAQAVVGGAEVFLDESGQRRVIRSTPTIQADEFWFRVVVGSPVSNAWFFRRELFREVGGFDTSYRYVADREFLIRLGLFGVRPVSIPRTLYLYRCHPGSATVTSLDSRSPERGLLRRKVLSENIRMLESFLNQRALLPSVRFHLRYAHSEQCYKLAATALYHRCWKEAGYAIKQGWRYEPVWPLLFLKLLFVRLQRGFSS